MKYFVTAENKMACTTHDHGTEKSIAFYFDGNVASIRHDVGGYHMVLHIDDLLAIADNAKEYKDKVAGLGGDDEFSS